MKKKTEVRRGCLPLTIIRHLEQQGLGWGHDLYACDVWTNSVGKKGR